MWQNLSEEELVSKTIQAINGNSSRGISISDTPDLSPELTRRLIITNRELNKSITKLHKATSFYSWVLIGLTVILAVTAILTLRLIPQ